VDIVLPFLLAHDGFLRSEPHRSSQLDGELRELLDLPDASAPEVLNAAFPNLHYIWLRRRDRLRQAVSMVRALQTRVWRSTMSPADPSRVPVFDFEAIDVAVRRLTWRERAWQRFFQQHGIRPFTLVYEDLTEDPASLTRQVLRYLGIELPNSFVFPTPQLQKQADELTEEWVRQYELLRRSRQEGWTPAPAAFGWSSFAP
jgi:LPS sulfotransferase NodH